VLQALTLASDVLDKAPSGTVVEQSIQNW